MNINEIEVELINPDKEYIINKKVRIDPYEAIILSYTIEKENNNIWILYKKDSSFLDNSSMKSVQNKTNEEFILSEIRSQENDINSFQKIKIQNQEINIDSCYFQYFYENDEISLLRLEHFIDINLIPEEWKETDISNFCLAQYIVENDNNEFIINEEKDMEIELTEFDEAKEIYIGKSFIGHVGEYEKDVKISYFDKVENKESFIYIDKIEIIDMADLCNEIFNEIEQNEEQRLFFDDTRDYFKNKKMLRIFYETEDNEVKFNFCTKKYLESSYEYDQVGIIGLYIENNEESKNGLEINYDAAKTALNENFDKDIEIVLFSKTINCKGKKYKFN